ncbi:ribonuclease E/G [Magnetovibrio sp. PR-2]|uniref:Rne/Rng family ribonuclease n=1 Tax=Magnetovibrio sp. PR-2 TaxID=3120356 RepID=UPI002FCE63D0
MTKRMLIDAAHPEETRVALVDGHQLEDFDVEVSSRRQLKGNIYLAKVVRVEPSLQAAFVDYGGNRHGFLAFSEIHPDYYQIPVEDRSGEELEDEANIIDVEPEEVVVEAEASEDVTEETSEDAGEDSTDDEEKPDGEIAADIAPEPFVPEDAPEEEAAEDAASEEEAPAEEASAEDAAAEASEEAPAEQAREDAPQDAEDEDVETVGGDESDEVEETKTRRHNHKNYKIQEVIKRRQVLLVQVVKEERGNKGAALTTYISLAGRYCVLMPNTSRGGGISRKITNSADRKSLKAILSSLDIPPGMAVILRTAGIGRTKAEIKRDFEYLIRLWKNVRDLTLQSTAPTLVHEEGDIVRRSIRDLYTRDIDDIQVEGEGAYKAAKEFMKLLIPSHARKVKQYKDVSAPLFRSAGVENQLDAIHNPVVNLPSGGYLVINPTEALVSIDVNSGRSTKERNIEETAVKTNLEAADEVARQLRLRDLAGLVVIDFIDMDINRNNSQVERRMKEALKHDRARIQVGRISPFGLLEMSRQRLRPSLIETSSEPCPHCGGTGIRRSTESTALVVLRAIDEEGANRRASELTVHVPTSVALYILNHKRDALAELEAKYDMRVIMASDDSLIPPDLRLERTKNLGGETISEMVATVRPEGNEDSTRRRRRRRRGRKRGDEGENTEMQDTVETKDNTNGDEDGEDGKGRRRRRSRRGGRRRRRTGEGAEEATENLESGESEESEAASEDGETREGEEKPKRRRRSRRRKPADAEDGAETKEASSEDAEGEDGEEKPKRRRRSRRRPKSSDTGDEAKAAEAAESSESSEDTSGADEGEEKPKRRRTRSRRKKADEGTEEAPKEAAAEAAAEPKVETPKVEAPAEEPKAPVTGVETVVVGEVEDKPKRKGWWNLG